MATSLPGLDALITDAENKTASQTGFGRALLAALAWFKAATNAFGSAALVDATGEAGAGSAGKVPMLDAGGQINEHQVHVATSTSRGAVARATQTIARAGTAVIVEGGPPYISPVGVLDALRNGVNYRATTSRYGSVRLADTTDTTSTDKAATPAGVTATLGIKIIAAGVVSGNGNIAVSKGVAQSAGTNIKFTPTSVGLYNVQLTRDAPTAVLLLTAEAGDADVRITAKNSDRSWSVETTAAGSPSNRIARNFHFAFLE